MEGGLAVDNARFADQLRLLRPGRKIALYLPLPEEIDTTPLLRRARRRGCRLYLPRIVDARRSRMVFVDGNGPLHVGRWGIHEPAVIRRVGTRELGVIFLPLVGFDADGNRMGMGKGFYDRALSFRIRHPANRRPLLVGLAYSFQQVESLPVRAHDVPLDMLITERGVWRFPSRHPTE